MRYRSVLLGGLLFLSVCLAPGALARAQGPDAYVSVSVYALNPLNQTAQVTLSVEVQGLYAVNSSNVTFSAGGSGSASFQLRQTAPGTYRGSSGLVSWGMVGYPQDYPFDSYALKLDGFTVNASGTGYPVGVIHASAAFQGYPSGMASIWQTTGANGSIPVQVGRGVVYAITARQPTWGVPLMLPIEIAFAFLGVSFFLDSRDRLTERLMIFMSVFVFSPVYLLSIQTNVPVGQFFNVFELQTVTLLTAVGILGVFSIVSHSGRSVTGRGAYDMISLLLSEALVIYFYNSFPGDSDLGFVSPNYAYVLGFQLLMILLFLIVGFASMLYRLVTEAAAVRRRSGVKRRARRPVGFVHQDT
ncbi:MAG: hypothetical protein JRN39_07645 [Nitrososphaerota archaeon]|nr:hypothetical protein [Nitrososphaerota archaeon]